MKTIATLLLLTLLAPASVSAGELYGTITDGDKSVGSGVKIEIKSAGNSYRTETDKYGAYRVLVREKGKCSIKVNYQSQSPSIDVFSYDKSVRYNLGLE